MSECAEWRGWMWKRLIVDCSFSSYQELKETVINDPTLLLNVITGDESIVYAYDPETKLQSSQWKSPWSPKPQKSTYAKKKIEKDGDLFL